MSIEIFNPFQYDFLSEKKVSARELFDAKNSFLFQFYMRGIRISDFIFLKWGNINNRKIEYKMRKTNQSISIPINHKLLYILRLYLPFRYKEQYFRDNNYADKEMFYSLNNDERAVILKRIKPKNYYDNFSNYSYQYEIRSSDKLLNRFNQLSISPEYKNKYIFNLLKSSQIDKLEKASKEEYNILEYNLIQSATALYNKQLKLLNKFVFDANGQVIKTNITSHLARHTYASIGVKLGFDVLTLSQSLGHQDLKTTQAYIKTLDSDFVDEENEKLFNNLGSNNDKLFEKTKNLVIVRKEDIKKIIP
ncbi:MAG: tyrosine-type recombinase/integrase [Bacteroidales bacterium]|nr:tyrosine-type recombinase/integrase [Bacteroidales bacterium]